MAEAASARAIQSPADGYRELDCIPGCVLQYPRDVEDAEESVYSSSNSECERCAVHEAGDEEHGRRVAFEGGCGDGG